MVQWTKRNPFGTFLLNIFITILTVTLAVLFVIKKYDLRFIMLEISPAIEELYKNSEEIKGVVIDLSKKECKKKDDE